MENIWEILKGFGPILFSGAVAGAIVSYLGPAIIKGMKSGFTHKKIIDLYYKYEKDPEYFAKKQPALKKFFDGEGWVDCPCANCRWFTSKLEKSKADRATQKSQEPKDASKPGISEKS